MNVPAAIPFRVASAYGLPRAVASQPPGIPAPAGRGIDGGPAGAARQLVGARVAGPVDLAAALQAPARVASSGILPLYTRAVDAIEAATAVMIGRAVDLRG